MLDSAPFKSRQINPFKNIFVFITLEEANTIGNKPLKDSTSQLEGRHGNSSGMTLGKAHAIGVSGNSSFVLKCLLQYAK